MLRILQQLASLASRIEKIEAGIPAGKVGTGIAFTNIVLRSGGWHFIN